MRYAANARSKSDPSIERSIPVGAMIRDEKKAIREYGSAAGKTQNTKARRTFRHIQGEEREHAKELRTIGR